jgi:hypothetical protein
MTQVPLYMLTFDGTEQHRRCSSSVVQRGAQHPGPFPRWLASNRNQVPCSSSSGRAAALHVRRAKNGKPSAHPLGGDEVRALHELRRQFPDSAFVFSTERGGPFTPDAVNRLIKRIGARARFAALSNAGHDTRRIQDWLGHRSIQHTTRYTQLSAPFKRFWR